MKKLKLFCLLLAVLPVAVLLLPVREQGSLQAQAKKAAAPDEVQERTNLLILGRDRAAGLTDSILLVSIPPQGGELSILQLPRDTYAAYTTRAYKKLNGAYAALGLSGVKNFLSRALGVPIPYAVALDLDCVTELVDAIGGVEVEIMQPMYAPGKSDEILLEPGVQTLSGEQAELFLRFRAGYANADLGRMDAQKQFLAATLQKLQEMGKGQMLMLAARMLPHTETDLPITELPRLIKLLPEAGQGGPCMETAPGEPVQGSSGAWYYSLNRQDTIDTVKRLLPGMLLTEDAFDPDRVFDRTDHPDFHRIYQAPGKNKPS